MIKRQIDEFDIRKLEEAKKLVEEVSNFYFGSTNSRDLVRRLDTVSNKLIAIIADAREYRRTHDRFGNRRNDDGT